MVVDILDEMPSWTEKLNAIKALLALNPNQYYRLVVLNAVDLESIRSKIGKVGNKFLIVQATEANLKKTIDGMFRNFQKAAPKNVAGRLEAFVLTGSQKSLELAGVDDNLRAAPIETDTIPSNVLAVAGTAAAVAFSQELLLGGKLSEKTNTSIQKRGTNRYQFRLQGLQALYNMISAEIQGLLSLQKAA